MDLSSATRVDSRSESKPGLASLTILLVEDEEADVFFLRRAFLKVGLNNPLRVASDGQQAIDYLKGIGEFSDRRLFPLPYLILLDLKLPRVMGLNVLRWIRAQPSLQSTIVVVLTSSAADRDLQGAYALGANAYLVKPADTTRLEAIARGIKDFWFTLNCPPPPDSGRPV